MSQNSNIAQRLHLVDGCYLLSKRRTGVVYQIDTKKPIGNGAFGSVFAAQAFTTNASDNKLVSGITVRRYESKVTDVVVKVARPGAEGSLFAELRAFDKIERRGIVHGIVQRLDYDRTLGPDGFIVLERLHTLPFDQRPSMAKSALRVFYTLLADLYFLTAGAKMYLRDIKKENIMGRLSREHDSSSPQEVRTLLQEGLMRPVFVDPEQLIEERELEKGRTSSIGGALRYVAPEQLEGFVTGSGDIYALGCWLGETLCGQRPFAKEEELSLIEREFAKLKQGNDARELQEDYRQTFLRLHHLGTPLFPSLDEKLSRWPDRNLADIVLSIVNAATACRYDRRADHQKLFELGKKIGLAIHHDHKQKYIDKSVSLTATIHGFTPQGVGATSSYSIPDDELKRRERLAIEAARRRRATTRLHQPVKIENHQPSLRTETGKVAGVRKTTGKLKTFFTKASRAMRAIVD